MPDTPPTFEVGKEYHRADEIHAQFGGQQRGGISTPKHYPVVFIFTSQEGEKHGYKDEYRENGIFWYTGAGQVGDMQMTSGNRAILEHLKDGKVLHVFEKTKKAYCRYIGTAECLDYHSEIRPDTNQNDRTAFIFHLDINSSDKPDGISEPSDSYNTTDINNLNTKNLSELREAALFSSPKNSTPTPKQKREIAYYRSQAIKLYVLARSNGKCEGCKQNAPFETKSGPFLECHHVHRIADGGPDQPKNVIALCPNCHRRAHYSKDKLKYNDMLKVRAIELENMAKE